MADIKLTDLISVRVLQEIQDGFAELTGMAALTTDENGTPVTKGSNFTEFCMELTRKNREGCRRCERCDKEGGEKTHATGSAVSYFCHAGLIDFAAPIMLNGKMIGSFIGGQVLTEEPDEDKFRRIAEDLGIDPERYVAAVKKVKIVEKKQVEAAANFLCTIAKVLSQSAFDAYIANQNKDGLVSTNRYLFAKVDQAENTVNLISKQLKELSAAFDTLEKIAFDSVNEVNQTSETIKQIQDIALNTKILGFNASIEASRAKEAGKGFGVIAQEVRSLAETSKHSADSIQDKMGNIKGFTSGINDNITHTRELVENCMKELKQFNSILEEIKNTSE